VYTPAGTALFVLLEENVTDCSSSTLVSVLSDASPPLATFQLKEPLLPACFLTRLEWLNMATDGVSGVQVFDPQHVSRQGWGLEELAAHLQALFRFAKSERKSLVVNRTSSLFSHFIPDLKSELCNFFGTITLNPAPARDSYKWCAVEMSG
jgi:hypothetical protein